jgi:hypothetical protein
MRSDLVFSAVKHISNRFLLTKVLAKATREFHNPGARIEDTTNDVLVRCSCATSLADETAVRSSTTVGSRRRRPHPTALHRAGNFAVLPGDESSPVPSEPPRELVA